MRIMIAKTIIVPLFSPTDVRSDACGNMLAVSSRPSNIRNVYEMKEDVRKLSIT